AHHVTFHSAVARLLAAESSGAVSCSRFHLGQPGETHPGEVTTLRTRGCVLGRHSFCAKNCASTIGQHLRRHPHRERPHLVGRLPPPILLAISIDRLLSIRTWRGRYPKSAALCGFAGRDFASGLSSASPSLSCHRLALVSHYARPGHRDSAGR